MPDTLEFKVGAFEGPLDLLLFLISKHKMDIQDIEISLILSQYMEYIAMMQEQDLEIASEFLEMAARLVYMKTVSLLPRHEEAAELKKELEGQLMEYKLCKEMAQKLSDMGRQHGECVRAPMKLKLDPTYTGRHWPEELLSSYLLVVGKAKRRLPPPKSAFVDLVEKPFVSVTSKIFFILRKLYKTGQMPYEEFFRSEDKSTRIAVFLALLELIKSSRISISDDNATVYFNAREKGRRDPA